MANSPDEYRRAGGRRATATDEQIDAFILAAARTRWLKVARIIADVLRECEREGLAADEFKISGRIRIMASDGRLEAEGSLARWRYSEVRRPETR